MREVVALIKRGKVVAFCGAGLSAESGIPTFRGKAGLWEKYDPQIYVNVQGIKSLLFSQADKLRDFIVDFYGVMLAAKPNLAHYTLNNLEKNGYLTGIITQNIDDFHTFAGSNNVSELHGNAYVLKCYRCDFSIKKTKEEWKKFIDSLKGIADKDSIVKAITSFMGRCPYCFKNLESCMVLFGQSLCEETLRKSYDYLNKAKTLLFIGTSGVVYPAASFPLYAKEKGAVVINVNPHDSSVDEIADFCIRSPALSFFENLSLHL